MDRRILFFALVSTLYLSLGCISFGTREIVMPDQEVLGNQGYMEGAPSTYEEREVKKKKIYDIEVEIPDLLRKDSSYSYDESIWGNQGYFQKGATKAPNIYIAPKKKVIPTVEPEEEYIESKETAGPSNQCPRSSAETFEVKYIDYVVVKGDSLWIIAKKVYGDANKWSLISENNQDILKGCKYLKPGMILKIPVSEEGRSQYIK